MYVLKPPDMMIYKISGDMKYRECDKNIVFLSLLV